MVLIAYLSMFVDHVFKFLAPSVLLTETITGRIAMPIFMYMVATGMKKTSSRQKYIYRLFIFAIVSQIPFILMINDPTILKFSAELSLFERINSVIVFFTNSFNIGFTLLITAILIHAFSKTNMKLMNKAILAAVMLFLAEILRVDYGWYGVLIGLMFYYVDIKHLSKVTIYAGIITTMYLLYRVGSQQVGNIYDSFIAASHQYWSLLAIPIIHIYANKKTKRPSKFVRWLKYSIYPIHMLIIFIIRVSFFS